jgi:hypothetical protein
VSSLVAKMAVRAGPVSEYTSQQANLPAGGQMLKIVKLLNVFLGINVPLV